MPALTHTNTDVQAVQVVCRKCAGTQIYNLLKILIVFRMIRKLKEFTGMTNEDIEKDQAEKKRILLWLIKNKVKTVNAVGKVIAEYYQNPEKVLKVVDDPKSTATDIVAAEYLEYHDE